MKFVKCIIIVLFIATYCVSLAAATHVQKRSDDVTPVEVQVGQMANQMASMSAELTALKNQVAQLQDQVVTVAFYAWSTSNPVTVAAHETIPMHHVETNVGHALDPLTSVFTAPVSGLSSSRQWSLSAHILAHDLGEFRVHAEIMVDGRTVARCLSHSEHGQYHGTAMHALVHVTQGHRVYVRNPDGVTINYFGNNYVTFSGVLIRAD